MAACLVGVTIGVGGQDNGINTDSGRNSRSTYSSVRHSIPGYSLVDEWSEAYRRAYVPTPTSTGVPTKVPSTPRPTDRVFLTGEPDNQEALPRTTLSEVAAGSPVLNNNELRRLVCSYSWPCEEALRVIECESGGRADAYNPTDSIGLFQIHYPSHYDKVERREDLFDPTINVAVAWSIYADSGWIPWECKP